jgi:hypothetical protein
MDLMLELKINQGSNSKRAVSTRAPALPRKPKEPLIPPPGKTRALIPNFSQDNNRSNLPGLSNSIPQKFP